MHNKTICMISCMHGLFDDRIYWKECISLKKKNYEVYHIGVSEENSQYISNEGIHIIGIKRKRYFKNPLLDKLYRILTFRKSVYKDILQASKHVKADVYHFHDLQINRIVKDLKELDHHPKIIYDVHECYPDMISSFSKKSNPFWIFFKLYSFYIQCWELSKTKYCDFFITAYPRIENYLIKHKKNVKTTIIYNFTTLEPRDNSRVEKKYDVIYLGAINRNRGIYEIIRTANHFKNIGRDIRFLILGPFHNARTEHKVRKLVEKLHLYNMIEFHKPVKYQLVESFLAQSKIALSIFLPVKVFFHAIQIKTFEYMANGLPIVCSNFGTINYFVNESKCGIPVNPENIEEIVHAIEYLLDNPDQYTLLSKNGIEAVKSKYNWETMERNLHKAYDEILASY